MTIQPIFLTILLLITQLATAQKVEVPTQVRFADMELDLTADAREKIQTDVDALTRYEKYFNAKVDRIDTYFPLIEQVLKEENVPEDIKYLVIQESSLVGDAVSSSNAVGYWQFKEATGKEVGLTINGAVDERMNIITATRGAARYFKNNNKYFDNWLYSLMAYYEGPGGALKKANKAEYGKKQMRLRGNTHWYVLKFLAHKFAFEQAIGRHQAQTQLTVYTEGNGKTLDDIAREFQLTGADLEPYNKWVRQRRIPSDKQYYVIIPSSQGTPYEAPLATQEPTPRNKRPAVAQDETASEPTNPTNFEEYTSTQNFPIIEESGRGEGLVTVNNTPGIIAREDETVRTLAQRAGISPSKLVRYNDLTNEQGSIVAGKPYYTHQKGNRGSAHYHVAQPGESLWEISQRVGIKLKKLMRNNRIEKNESLQPGRVLWLRFIRPARVPIAYQKVDDTLESETPWVAQQRFTPTDDARPQPGSTAQNTAEKAVEEAWSNADFSDEVSERAAPAPAEDRATASLVEEETKEEAILEEPASSEEEVWKAVQPQGIPDTHTVQSGETWYSIAKQYQLSMLQLTQYNGHNIGDPLQEGQTLRLTPSDQPKRSESSVAYHEVQPGETMYQVARQYDVSIQDLMEWNQKKSFNLTVGEKLQITAQPSETSGISRNR